MALEADTAARWRKLKRSVTLWRVIGIVALVALVITAFGTLGDGPRGERVARLQVSDMITDDTHRTKAIRKAARDPAVKALLVRINSPGGTVVGGESLYSALRHFAKSKPVVASMGEMATSAGYMTALGADHIVAHSGSLTGSIGVILQSAEVTGLLDKLGIEPVVIKSGPLKAEPNPLQPLTEEAREAALEVVMDMYRMFIDMVVERRAIDRGQVELLADGRVFTGRQALDVGLVDALGGEREARDWLAEEHEIDANLPLVDLEIKGEEPWRRLLQQGLGKALFNEPLRLDGLMSVWHPRLF